MSTPGRPSDAPMRPLPRIIFFSRWLQLPLYLGLIAAQGVYVYKFLAELWHLISHAATFDETQIMLVVLGLIDVVMISNLLIMVIIGGYETFVSRLGVEGHPDEPEWLDHVNAGVLKVKLSMALISISSIHLLKTFISPDQHTTHTIMWQVIIHVAFLVSALVMAFVDRLTTQNQTRAPVAHRDDGGAADHVVTTRQGIAVGTGGGHPDQVAGSQVPRDPGVAHDDIAALAMLSDDTGQLRRGIAEP